MSEVNGLDPTEVQLKIVQAIHGHSVETAALTEALVSDQRQARLESDRRFNKQSRKLRVLAWALGFVVLLGLWSNVQQAIESARRDDRAASAEAQRKCVSIIQNAALARLAILATATPSRVNGGPAVDPLALGRLREDVALSGRMSDPDPVLMVRIRDEVAQILAAIPADTTEAQRLRDDVAQANRALLEVDRRCFTGTPSDNPLAN